MQVTSVVSPDAFIFAVNEARGFGTKGEPVAGLGAPLGGALIGVVGRLWDGIEAALQSAYRYGAEKAAELRDKAIEQAEEAIDKAGTDAEQIRLALLNRMQTYEYSLVRRALEQLDATINVGEASLELANIEITRKLLFSGSLKASITELVALTGGGEITLGARYTLPGES